MNTRPGTPVARFGAFVAAVLLSLLTPAAGSAGSPHGRPLPGGTMPPSFLPRPCVSSWLRPTCPRTQPPVPVAPSHGPRR